MPRGWVFRHPLTDFHHPLSSFSLQQQKSHLAIINEFFCRKVGLNLVLIQISLQILLDPVNFVKIEVRGTNIWVQGVAKPQPEDVAM